MFYFQFDIKIDVDQKETIVPQAHEMPLEILRRRLDAFVTSVVAGLGYCFLSLSQVLGVECATDYNSYYLPYLNAFDPLRNVHVLLCTTSVLSFENGRHGIVSSYWLSGMAGFFDYLHHLVCSIISYDKKLYL